MFCFQSKNWKKDFGIGGIKFKVPQLQHSKHSKNDLRLHPNNVEKFYNIAGERNWIESALTKKKYDGVIVNWVYVKKVRFLDHVCGQKNYDNTKTEKTAQKCRKALLTCQVNNVMLLACHKKSCLICDEITNFRNIM